MATVVTTDLDRYYQDVAKAAGLWGPEMAKAHAETALRAVEWAQFAAAGSGSRQRQQAFQSIKPKATETSAAITVSRSASFPYALPAFWGAKRRTGWYAAAKFEASKGKQFAPWVGASWEVAVAGQGPYAINDALAAHLRDIDEFFLKAVDRATSAVYPE